MSTALIIGASRGIGLETVKLALKAGHSVRAMARSATAIRLRDPKLEKLNGDALDQHTLERRRGHSDAWGRAVADCRENGRLKLSCRTRARSDFRTHQGGSSGRLGA